MCSLIEHNIHLQMDINSIHKQIYNSGHRSIKNHQNSTFQPPSFPATTTAAGFPLLAIAIACITAITFMLVTYFFITKCCYPLTRFLIAGATTTEQPPSTYSTPARQTTGLDESLINKIPIFRYTRKDGENKRLYKCVICLTEFRDSDTLRVLPSCNHGFHLNCIDTWLRNNPNCPICRLNVSGTTQYPIETMLAPNSSPNQDPYPIDNIHASSDQDFVIIELGEEGNESRKAHSASIMSERRIVDEKDEQFVTEPIRRSFSMDSAVDRHVYLSVQDIIRNNEEACRTRRPFFAFGNARGSRSAVLPFEF